jgi:fructokinase
MILCCGEALIDMLPCIDATGEPAFAPHTGGAAFNTAVALGRLGAPAALFSGLSTDLFGRRLAAALRASNVDLAHASFSDRPTTLAFVHVENGQASYSFHDENTAGRMLAETDLPALPASVKALLFGGISLASEPCGSTYEALMRREHAARVIVLDPNIRAGCIDDRNRHLARMRRMIAMADIVKLSEEDMAWFGEQGGDDEIATRWLETGPKLVVLKRGGEGATGNMKYCRTDVPAKATAVADTIGAGDTFNAGMLFALDKAGMLSKSGLADLSEDCLRSSLDFASQAAAVTVSRHGANPPWRHELD